MKLTVRQRSDHNILSGDAGAVFVIRHHPKTVLRKLLEARHGVGQTRDVHVLQKKHKQHQLLKRS